MRQRHRKKAPYKDFAGNEIYEGDVIVHPSGEWGTVIYVDGYKGITGAKNSNWRVKYEETGDFLYSLTLQVGDKGQAVVAKVDQQTPPVAPPPELIEINDMTCYIQKFQPPTKSEYKIWQNMGYFGSWEDYCEWKSEDTGKTFFLCGNLGAHCADCSGLGEFLCDYPVGDGKTCDRTICIGHAHEIAPEIHYCAAHYKMWQEFKRSGGVDDALKNVIAFRVEK